MGSQDYRDLEVWKRGVALVTELYRLTGQFPADERFGLTSQLRRAAVSVPANIAEGQARLHKGDFVHHLSIARGSLAETDTLLVIAVELGYLSPADSEPIQERVAELRRMIHGLINSLSTSQKMYDR